VSPALSGADVGHLAVAVGLTYALGFERALRGAPAGDRVFALIGAGSGVVGNTAAAIWSGRFSDDDAPPRDGPGGVPPHGSAGSGEP
jgi:hypothetical protein